MATASIVTFCGPSPRPSSLYRSLGTIGSRQRVKTVLPTLTPEGIPETASAPLYAPVGPEIHAELLSKLLQYHRPTDPGWARSVTPLAAI